MRERPLLFSAPMVLAILAGRKTQTRRVVKPQAAFADAVRFMGCEEDPDHENDAVIRFSSEGHSGAGCYVSCAEYPEEGSSFFRCPYGAPGERLWVKEAFRLRADQDHKPPRDDAWKDSAWYEATGNGEKPSGCGGGIGRLRPSIFMPRWASRITLEITEVRVQRLQEITEEDAKAEGVDPLTHMFSGEPARDDYRAGFEIIWRNINGAASWDGNPWVWCVSFKRSS